jgi:hypothetical protein
MSVPLEYTKSRCVVYGVYCILVTYKMILNRSFKSYVRVTGNLQFYLLTMTFLLCNQSNIFTLSLCIQKKSIQYLCLDMKNKWFMSLYLKHYFDNWLPNMGSNVDEHTNNRLIIGKCNIFL